MSPTSKQWLRVAVFLLAVPVLAATTPAQAQMGTPPAAGGLPPFLAKMQRYDVTVQVLVRHAGDSATSPAPAGLPVSIIITAGGSKVRNYDSTTEADGVARFTGIPTNPEVQKNIGYVVHVDSGGVRFPFTTDTIPTDGGHLEVTVSEVGANADDVSLEHTHVELFPDEENLVVRHSMQLVNRGNKAVDLSQLPGGGLKLSLPAGGKHPELHEDIPAELVEVRGTDLYYKGVVPPGGKGSEVTVVYTIEYSDALFEWSQAVPVRVTGGMVVAPTGRQKGQRTDIPLHLLTRGGQGVIQTRDLEQGRRFEILRMPDIELAPNEPMRFAIAGLPTSGQLRPIVMGAALLGVIAFVFLGFRAPAAGESTRLSRAHLENERDRLQKALDRMRKAVDKGRLSAARFEREQEAITARLVTLYRTLERLDNA